MTIDKRIRSKILELVDAQQPNRTICPSEVARALTPENWRDLMPQIRACADELKIEGKLKITQKGKVIESAAEARGPIRLSRAT